METGKPLAQVPPSRYQQCCLGVGWRVLAKSRGPGTLRPGFGAELCPVPVVWPGGRNLTSSCLSFLIGVILMVTSWCED